MANLWLLGEKCKPMIIRDAYGTFHFLFPGTPTDLTKVKRRLAPIHLFILCSPRSNRCTRVTKNRDDFLPYFVWNFCGLGYGYILEGCQIERHLVIAIALFK